MHRLTEPERRLNFTFASNRLALPGLIAMTDEDRGIDPVVLADRVPANTGLLFRHYTHPNRQQLAERVIERCLERRVFCLVAGDPELACKLGANGVHMPERALGSSRRLLAKYKARGGLVTSSAHSLRAAQIAMRCGVDALFVSPVFSTKSHPDGRALGLSRFARIIRDLDSPVYGLGGIDRRALRRIQNTGAYGIAGIGLFQSLLDHVDSRKTG